MSYLPRSLIVGNKSIMHVYWKCHNSSWFLRKDLIKKHYYDLLKYYMKLKGMIFFSYCFMDNHVHLCCQCKTQIGLSNFFRAVHSRLAKYINKIFHRRGQAIMDRFESPTIESDEHLFRVMIYNILNPARTKKRIHPKDYKWSAYHFFAYGKEDPLLTEPYWYLELGKTPEERQRKFRHIINQIMANDPQLIICPYKTKKGQKLHCVGTPEWVAEKMRMIREVAKEKRKEWQKMFEKSLIAAGIPPDLYKRMNPQPHYN